MKKNVSLDSSVKSTVCKNITQRIKQKSWSGIMKCSCPHGHHNMQCWYVVDLRSCHVQLEIMKQYIKRMYLSGRQGHCVRWHVKDTHRMTQKCSWVDHWQEVQRKQSTDHILLEHKAEHLNRVFNCLFDRYFKPSRSPNARRCVPVFKGLPIMLWIVPPILFPNHINAEWSNHLLAIT